METFSISTNDKGLSIMLKREANIILASLDKKSNEYFYKKERFEEVLSVIKAIENTNPQNEYELDFILNTINNIYNIGVLSPLTLKDDEFSKYADFNGYFYNIRYNDIYIDTDLNKSICNKNAFNLYTRNAYCHYENSQIECTNEIIHKNHRIYISKGGIITGEYIEKCIIKPSIVNNHSFVIKPIPNIPVSIIIDKDNTIYTVDHREPILKILQKYYDIPINKDENIANKHYNIRKYNKIK